MAIDSIHPNTPGLDRSLAFREARLPGSVQTGAAYTPELADIEKIVRFTGTGAATVTVPHDDALSFPIGTVLTVSRDGTGTVAIAGAAGVTVNRDAGTTAAIATQYGMVNLRKTGANTWALSGTLVAA